MQSAELTEFYMSYYKWELSRQTTGIFLPNIGLMGNLRLWVHHKWGNLNRFTKLAREMCCQFQADGLCEVFPFGTPGKECGVAQYQWVAARRQ